MTTNRNAISVFLSYAHEDEPLLRQLETHLSLLKRQGLISTWYDRQVVPGTDWAKAIDERLEQASIILLLVSPDFLASDYCYHIEMKRALERHDLGQARVIPIALRPVDWKDAPFARLQTLPTDAKAITTWSNQDKAMVNVVAGIRRAIEDLSLLPASTSHMALPAIWNIPYPRNPFFLERDDLLLRLHTQLQAGQAISLSQSPHAVSGLGGIGKTQIAVEYAYCYHHEYKAVLWVRAESKDTLTSSYNTIATLLKLPEREAQEPDIIIGAVNRWLQTHRKWLLILDNADDLDLLPPFLPTVAGGHILLTTRAWDMQRLAIRLEVETFSDEQGMLFLLRRAGLLAPDVELSQASPEDRLLATQLTQELGGLPLALDQAGAYLEATGTSLNEYYQMYQKHRKVLLQERRSRILDHPDSVATTWLLSFQRIEEKSVASADLLRFCAYLAPDTIPEEIIIQGAQHLGSLLKSVATDSFLFAQTIEVLRAYSLVSRDPRTRTLSIHRLVQAVLRDNMPVKSAHQWRQRAILAVNAACPEVEDVKQWGMCERWLPHALVCASWIEQEQTSTHEAVRLLNRAGYYLNDHGRYAEAERLLVRALSIHKQILSSEHADIVSSLNDLAEVFQNQGRYAEVERLYKQALSIREEQLGPKHLDMVSSLSKLADLYKAQGKYEVAEPLYQRAHAICEQQLGPKHLDTVNSLGKLADLYRVQGRYELAEPLYQRVHAICEQQLGTPLLFMAQNLNGLASLYQFQGKYEQAEPLFKQALAIREQQLGVEHPLIASSFDRLALLYLAQGKYEQAEPLFKQALAIREQRLGAQHPVTATSLNYLARFYQNQGKYEQAESLYRHALEILEQPLETQHPYIADILHNLANLHCAQGNYARAEPLYQRALHILEKKSGPKTPSIQSIRRSYASCLRALSRDAEAEKLEGGP